MLIFDGFGTMRQAKRFAGYVKATWGRNAVVCQSQDDSNRIDPFPFVLDAPIVLVQRNDNCSGERPIEKSAPEFGGRFAGT